MSHLVSIASYLLLLCHLNQIPSTFSASVGGKTLTEEECHPTPDPSSQFYILGYGSLLNSPSKRVTYPDTGINIPVNVTGFTRNWNCKGSPIGHSTTFLGVDEGSATDSFNGVVFKLSNLESLLGFDRREIYYCRKLIPRTDIHFLIDKNWNASVEQDYPDADAKFWIYTVKPEFAGWPNERYPIVQSYVDVFLAGCIEMEETYNITGYKDACITSTNGWNYNWINDRILPRRPWVHTPKSTQIDRLINFHFPNHFDQISIEQEIKYNGRSTATTISGGNHHYLLILLTVFGNMLSKINEKSCFTKF